MSLGYGGAARLVLSDGESAIYAYAYTNLNERDNDPREDSEIYVELRPIASAYVPKKTICLCSRPSLLLFFEVVSIDAFDFNYAFDGNAEIVFDYQFGETFSVDERALLQGIRLRNRALP